MSAGRIGATLGALRAAGRKALIPYITAGDPHPRHTAGLMHALVDAGADLVELGVPFSDPMADGPVIQLACERALAAGTTLSKVLDIVAQFRRRDARPPVVLMGYLNPVEACGAKTFARRAREAGVDGVLMVDLAVEEAPGFAPALRAEGLDNIFLVAPTTSRERIAAIAREASGYLYYVSLKGVTGAGTIDVASVAARLREIRAVSGLPVAVGFGVRDAATARAVGQVADAVVVGSALVGEIAKNVKRHKVLPKVLGARLALMRKALDALPASRLTSRVSRP
ncbi:MAG TPA: tryptophan synthase subunit alpha [Candidatus Binatia bacterium]|nr:tryptophan synthase subunit alpha [Candidatus Binatia bacterium]